MKQWFLFGLCWLISLQVHAHGMDELQDSIQVGNITLYGTLSMPAHAHQAMPLVIIIAGSGPTDRDGNQPGMRTDSYKKLAHGLAYQGIACFRYDKRGAGSSIAAVMKESELRFTDYVNDARAIITRYSSDKRFSKVTVAGHSEGSLIGMMAVGAKNDFISLCGAGQTAPQILKTQLRQQLGALEAPTFKKIDSLEQGMSVTCDNPMLMSLLRPSVQPYLMSWFKVNPAVELKKVTGRILLVGGSKDIQVSADQLNVLKQAVPEAQSVLFPDMNHVLVNLYSSEKQDNYASYNKPDMPIAAELIDKLVAFIKG